MGLFKMGLFVVLSIITSSAFAAVFTFTAIPDENESQLRTRFEKVATYLETELGVEVKYIPVKSYSAAVTAFRNNQVQLAWFGGLSGVQARRLVPGSEAIAQGDEDQFFQSYFIAHESAQIFPSDSFPNLNGLTFTFGAKGSTSGRLMPEFFIERNLGKKPKMYLSGLVFQAITVELLYKCSLVLIKSVQSIIKFGKRLLRRDVLI